MIRKLYYKWLRKQLIDFMLYIKKYPHSVKYDPDVPVSDYMYLKSIKE